MREDRLAAAPRHRNCAQRPYRRASRGPVRARPSCLAPGTQRRFAAGALPRLRVPFSSASTAPGLQSVSCRLLAKAKGAGRRA